MTDIDALVAAMERHGLKTRTHSWTGGTVENPRTDLFSADTLRKAAEKHARQAHGLQMLLFAAGDGRNWQTTWAESFDRDYEVEGDINASRSELDEETARIRSVTDALNQLPAEGE